MKEPFSIDGVLVEAGNIEVGPGDLFTGLLIRVPMESLKAATTMPLYQNVRIVEITDEHP